MRICFAVSAMESGGAERVVSTLSAELIKKGHQVTIMMVSSTKTTSYYALDENVNLIALCEGKKKASNPIKRVSALRRYFNENKPDVVVAFLPHICIYTWLALKNTDIPYILSERNDPNQYSIIYKLLIQKAFKDANACVFQTHDALAWYRKHPKETDRVIFNSVGLTFVPEIKSNLVKKKTVLFVGRLDSQKNYKMLLNAFKMFLDIHQNYILDVYGDGPKKENFLSMVNVLGIQKNVRYHGKSRTWHKDEYDAGIYVSTSDYEGMSNSLEEAAALGIPCVATNCPIGGSAELATAFNNIILTKVNDEFDFLQGMEKAIDMKSCFEGVNIKVDKKTIVEEWLSLINTVLGEKR